LKKWYQKKKVWAAILGALLPVLTLLLAPKDIETVKVLAAAIIEAGVAAGFIFVEGSVDKAGVTLNTEATMRAVLQSLDKGRELFEKGLAQQSGFKARKIAELQDAADHDNMNVDKGGG